MQHPGSRTTDRLHDGASSVLDRNRVGIYAGYHVVRRSLDAGKAQYACQTLAWSGPPHRGALPTTSGTGKRTGIPRAQLRQHLQIRVSDVSVIFDEAFATDYGQCRGPRIRRSREQRSVRRLEAFRGRHAVASGGRPGRSTTVPDALWLMAQNKPDRFGDLQWEYIGGEDWDAAMPKDMTYGRVSSRSSLVDEGQALTV